MVDPFWFGQSAKTVFPQGQCKEGQAKEQKDLNRQDAKNAKGFTINSIKWGTNIEGSKTIQVCVVVGQWLNGKGRKSLVVSSLNARCTGSRDALRADRRWRQAARPKMIHKMHTLFHDQMGLSADLREWVAEDSQNSSYSSDSLVQIGALDVSAMSSSSADIWFKVKRSKDSVCRRVDSFADVKVRRDKGICQRQTRTLCLCTNGCGVHRSPYAP